MIKSMNHMNIKYNYMSHNIAQNPYRTIFHTFEP